MRVPIGTFSYDEGEGCTIDVTANSDITENKYVVFGSMFFLDF